MDKDDDDYTIVMSLREVKVDDVQATFVNISSKE